MSTLLAPPATQRPTTQPPTQVPPPPAPRVTSDGASPGRLVAGYAQTLLVLLPAALTLVAGLTLLQVDGWPTVAAAEVGWGVAVAAWLQHRGWPAARAHLTVWIAPAAVLAVSAAVGWLAPAGLVLWGPVSSVLSVALAAVYDPTLVSRPARRHRTP